jgi:glucose-1-phosphate thymidylyltransferase
MKGILLAGGTGTRLWPITKSISKQLVPVYDKPMIYYPISTLMLTGVREILIITTTEDQKSFQKLLHDGTNLGLEISYAIQEQPLGLAQALIIGEEFLDGSSCLMILGDNIFHGVGLGAELAKSLPHSGARIFTYAVSNPQDYGVIELDLNGLPKSISEKPTRPKSNLAVTGLYFFDSKASEIAKKVQPSLRGELEIISVIDEYLKNSELSVTQLSRGTVWLDTGSPYALHDASTFVRVIEDRSGLKIGCPEEIAYRNNWISKHKLLEIAAGLGKNTYSDYLCSLVNSKHEPDLTNKN